MPDRHPSTPGDASSHYFSIHPLAPATPDVPRKAGRDNTRITARARGLSLDFNVGPQVFSKGGLDAGTRLLIETAQWEPEAKLCDLGCGWGAVGCFAAATTPDAQVALCDINRLAVELACHNIRDLRLNNAVAWCGDGLKAARRQSFDTVLCNPPVRAGNAVMAGLFDDAHAGLRQGGSLWLVLRTAQGAKSWQRRLAECFGDCQTASIEHGYRIFRCIKCGN